MVTAGNTSHGPTSGTTPMPSHRYERIVYQDNAAVQIGNTGDGSASNGHIFEETELKGNKKAYMGDFINGEAKNQYFKEPKDLDEHQNAQESGVKSPDRLRRIA